MSKDMNGTQPKMKQIYALLLAGTQDIFQRCIQYYLEGLSIVLLPYIILIQHADMDI